MSNLLSDYNQEQRDALLKAGADLGAFDMYANTLERPPEKYRQLAVLRVLPISWTVEQEGEDGAAYLSTNGLKVISTVAMYPDAVLSPVPGEAGQPSFCWWQHVSISRQRRLPSYDDLCQVKDIFIGHEREALQKFAKTSEHVNIHPYVLHLWCCLTRDVTPDFTRGFKTI